MVVGCWGPRQQGHTSSSDYVTPVTAAPVRGCTPNCLRKPAAGSHPSSGRGIPVSLFPFLKRTRTQEGCKVTGITHPPRPRVYPRQPSRACSLSYRPSCHSCRPLKPTSLAADQPLCQRRLCQPLPPSLPPSRGRAENTEHHRHCHPRISFSRRPSYAATAITFVGKSSEAVREPRADAARGGARPQQIFFLRLLFFLSFSTFSFTLSGEERFFRAIDKII